jgi:hypothetical protein
MDSEQSAAARRARTPDARVLAAFGLSGEVPIPLPYGEGRSCRVGSAILKHLHGDSAEVVTWDANVRAGILEDGFRIDRPLPTQTGDWLTDDGWSASTVLTGHHVYRAHVPACIAAIERYHTALRAYPRPALFDTLDGPYRRADRHAGLGDRLIHGDLNPGNLLIADGLPPGIIDMAPYWRPAEFALAVFAYWIGPWRNRPDLLAYFSHVEQLGQLLIRAGLRMLLFMSESGRLMDMDRYTRATQLILERNSH